MQKVTLGILAHVDSGKTTLSEGLLYASGALRRFDGAAHVLEVGHRAADALGGHLETEVVIRLEQHIFRLHQALTHGTVRRLTEIAALGVLQMRAARDKCELHIRHR